MRRLLVAFAAVTMAPCLCVRGAADELRDRYVTALRDIGYADLAIDYLEKQLERPLLSRDERGALEFQIAASMITASESLKDLSRREQRLEDARRAFEKWVADYPELDAVKKAEALVNVATIDLQQGRLRVVQAQLPANAGRADVLAAEAREFFTKSAKAYESAYQAFQSEYEEFPVYIPEERLEDRQLRQRKSALFAEYIEAQFQSALARFYLADSYASIEPPKEPNSDDQAATKAHEVAAKERQTKYLETINRAQGEFRRIYDLHRRELIGQYAHLWMARCMAAQGDHRRAMGIFEHLMEHENPELRRFQRDVFYFSMLSLAARGESDQIRNRAETWLRTNRRFRRESSYLGVQMELAKAYAKLAEKAATDQDRDRLRRDADEILDAIAGFPNEYQGLARRLQLDLAARTGSKGPGARGFNQLFSLANAKLDQLSPETPEEQRRELLRETKRLFRAAISAAGASTTRESINEALLALAYTHLQADEVYEAAILSEHLARAYPKSRAAPQAALFGVTAYAFGYEHAIALQRNNVPAHADSDAEHLNDLAAYLCAKWPESKEADDVRLTVGRLEFSRHNFTRASDSFDAVDPASAAYAEARHLAGLVYWDSFREAAQAEEKDQQVLADLRTDAIERLTTASELFRKAAGSGIDRVAFLNDAILGEALYEAGDDVRALAVLAPLVEAIDAGTLPKAVGPQLRSNALITALQANIRRSDLGATDKLVELIGRQRGAGSAGNVTLVFVSLANRIKEQIDRLDPKTDAEARAKTVAAFEAFLDRVAAREEGQTISTRIYIAKSFVELGEYGKAVDLLEDAIGDPQATSKANKPLVIRARILLARCRRMERDFARARKLIDQVYRENRNVPEVILERGAILDAKGSMTGDYKDAILHWKDVIGRMQRTRPRPETFYVAMDNLLRDFRDVPSAERKKRLKEGYVYARFLVHTDVNLPPEWKSVFVKHLAAIESALGLPKS